MTGNSKERSQNFFRDIEVAQSLDEEIKEHLHRGIVILEGFFLKEFPEQKNGAAADRIILRVESRALIDEIEHSNGAVH